MSKKKVMKMALEDKLGPPIPEDEYQELMLDSALAVLEEFPKSEYWQAVRDRASRLLHGFDEDGELDELRRCGNRMM